MYVSYRVSHRVSHRVSLAFKSAESNRKLAIGEEPSTANLLVHWWAPCSGDTENLPTLYKLANPRLNRLATSMLQSNLGRAYRNSNEIITIPEPSCLFSKVATVRSVNRTMPYRPHHRDQHQSATAFKVSRLERHKRS